MEQQGSHQQQNWQHPPYPQNNALPNATTILVLGILSLVFCGVIGLVLSIIALNMAKKALLEVEMNPNAYTLNSIKNMKAGKTCATIGLILSCVGILFMILYFVFIATMVTSGVMFH